MRNFRRFMSASLATLMIALALMTGAGAKSYEDVAKSDRYAEQIEILSDIGVIKGTSDTAFSPDQNVTREQMAMLLFRLMIGKDSAGTINSTPFTDLYDKTYNGAISWANASGYILGTSGTTFSPKAGITLQDAMTMIVRVLGHDTEKMNMGYPWTYIDAAIDLGLDKELEDVEYTETLTRAEVSAILYNALTAEYLIPRTAPNGMTYFESTTIIERVFGYTIDESVIVATNNFALEGVDTVTKTGYVTVHTDAGFLTVSYSELGIDGGADEKLGQSVKLVYKRDDKTKLVSVLGATEIGKATPVDKIEIDSAHKNVTIGGVRYQVVEELSDALSTNENELLVYAYGADGTLAQITSNEALAALLGSYDATLIFDDKNSDAADRLIIKSYTFGKLQIEDGKVNIADNMKMSDITVKNPDKAEDGDYVLYYFNSANKTLEIVSALPMSASSTVSRLTNTTATMGGKTFSLGNAKLGITAASIRDQLSVGENVRVVVYDNAILAVDTSVSTTYSASKYLIAESEVTPVFTGGKFRYVMDAIIDGKKETILVSNSSVTNGDVYRYTVSADGEYTLIEASVSDGAIETGDDKFVQSNDRNSEIAFTVGSADATTIEKAGAHYTISAGSADSDTSLAGDPSSVKFIMNKDTMIIVKIDGVYTTVNGTYSSTITVNDGASVTAIFDNEVGAVETLRFLYISDGELGSIDAAAHSVKVLAHIGKELVDGKVYNLYSVLNLATGKVDTMMSRSDSLTEGTNYLTTIDGLISDSEASVTSGVVSGYTGTTVTIGGTTYKISADTKFTKLNANGTVSTITVKDTFMGNVEVISEDGFAKSVIFLGKVTFASEYADGDITVSANETLTDADTIALSSVLVYDDEQKKDVPVDTEGFTVARTEGDTLTFKIETGTTLEAGTYTIYFKVNGVNFITQFTVE